MKLLFSSSDQEIVDRVSQKLVDSGIQCEIRSPVCSPEAKALAYYPELWIRNEEDFKTAGLLLAARCRPVRERVISRPRQSL